jgi:hypothetical protein
MMRKILCTLTLFTVVVTANGQDSLSGKWFVPTSVIKFSPLHLINFYPTVELSYEQRVASRVTIQVEGGYVFDNNDGFGDFDNKRGFKAKLEPRYYLLYSDKHPMNVYISAEVYLNRIDFDRNGTVTECLDGNCDFEIARETTYVVRYRERGGTVKCGWMKHFGRFLLDFNAGWTVRVVRYHGSQDQYDDDYSWFDIPNERNRTAFSPNVGLRMGFRIK